MKIELTKSQITEVIWGITTQNDFNEIEQRRLAMLIFSRNDRIDPFFALKAVVKQIASEYCLTREQVLEQLK